jgi:hypothetical protein
MNADPVDPCAGIVCQGLSNKCVNGVCKCGDNPACNPATSNACVQDTCKCGDTRSCDPATSNKCEGGACKCGNNPPCDPQISDNCSQDTCKCGNSPTCDKSGQQCENKMCDCLFCMTRGPALGCGVVRSVLAFRCCLLLWRSWHTFIYVYAHGVNPV